MSDKDKEYSKSERAEREFEENRRVERIPAKEPTGEEASGKKRKVAAYCRVSTDSEEQMKSYVTQKKAYEDLIKGREDWIYVDIYADPGISGTSLKHREDFNRMLSDAKAGKIDMIITKSISRFARNVVDCVTIVRKLKDMNPPVAVFFEDMNINTLSMSGELLLVILAAVAQGESEMKSISVKWGFRKRFEKGIPKIGPLYGYDKDGRNLTINEPEAAVVRVMFSMLLDGQPVSHICNVLNQQEIPSPKGKKWTYSTVRSILSNEKYCGDVVTQKTICIDMFEHKTVKNTGQLDQFKIPDHHEPIVSKDAWEEAQQLLANRERHQPRWEDWLEQEREDDQPGTGLKGFSVIKVHHGSINKRILGGTEK